MTTARRLLYLVLTLVASSLQAVPWQGFTSLVLSGDGRVFATGGRSGEAVLWDAETGESLGRWQLPAALPVVGLVFTDSGSAFAAVTLDGTASLCRVGSAAAKLPATDPLAQALAPFPARWLSFSPLLTGLRIAQGGLWVEGSSDGRLSVGKTGSAKASVQWKAHQAVVTGLALSADGSILFSCAYDGTLARWDTQTGRLLGRL